MNPPNFRELSNCTNCFSFDGNGEFNVCIKYEFAFPNDVNPENFICDDMEYGEPMLYFSLESNLKDKTPKAVWQ